MHKLKGFFVFLFSVLALWAISSPASAATVISQDILEETWTKDSSPYIVSANVWAFVSLTIEPGVVVKFMPGMSINLPYHFSAVGTEDEKIVFTSYKDDSFSGDTNGDGSASAPASGDWGGVKLSGNGNKSIEHAMFAYGSTAGKTGGNIEVFYTSVSIKHCEIRDGGFSGIMIYYSQPTIEENIITKNGIGVYSWQSYLVTIRKNRIFGNGKGAVVDSMSAEPGFWLDARENWWGDNTGPYYKHDKYGTDNLSGKGDSVTDGVQFDPWTGKDELNKRNPVIIIPGIMGSRLDKNEPGSPEIWPNIDRMLISPSDDFLYDLSMNDAGYPLYDNIRPTELTRKILTKDIYQGLIDELGKNGYTEGENLFVFPYDWRMDLDWIAGDAPLPYVSTLKSKIAQVKDGTGSEKVDIVAHSMGGLVAKTYLEKYGNASVGKFVDIATPHYGSPKAFKTLMYGDDMGINFFVFNLNFNTVKDISQNMPSIFELLPSKEYFNLTNAYADDNYKSYVIDLHDFDNNGIKGSLNFSQSDEFLKNAGFSGSLLQKADNLHNRIDGMFYPESFNLVGCGVPTIGKIYILNKEKSGGYEYGLKYIDGDSTVPLRSAQGLSAPAYYFPGIEHGSLPAADGVRELVASILNGEEGEVGVESVDNLSGSGACSISGTQVSFHSPIELHIYDEEGNHAGPGADGSFENNIPGLQYDIIEGNKFAFLPKGGTFLVEGRAESAGTFNARVQTVEDGEYSRTRYYNEVELQGADTTVKLELGSEDCLMLIDGNGDGTIDREVAPSSILELDEAEDQVRPLTTINVSGATGDKDWYVSGPLITLTAEDGDGSGVLKTEYAIGDEGFKDYLEPVLLSKEGIFTFRYFSTDRAGNIEEEKTKTIKIDGSSPVVALAVPAEGEKYKRTQEINIKADISDSVSGVSADSVRYFFDGKEVESRVDLFYKNLGGHLIMVEAKDIAGNTGQDSSGIIIEIDINGVIEGVKRLDRDKHFSKKIVKEFILTQLTLVKKFSDKGGKNSDKIIKNSLTLLLKQVELYHRLNWVDDIGYGIIKSDLEYLLKTKL